MKKTFIIPALLLVFSISSCKKEINPVDEQNTSSAMLSKGFTSQGTGIFSSCDNWHVASFIENGADITNDYKSLQFIFCPDNRVTVSNDLLSFDGSWYLLLGKGGSASYLELDFNSRDGVAFRWPDLEGMWKIDEMEQNVIRLQMEDGSKSLVFIKGSK